MTDSGGAAPPRRVAVVGDVGGHLDALTAQLRELGADVEVGTLPPGLEVVQVGDLVHRGPDSEGVVALVDRFVHRTRRWHQLIGNHEQQYLRKPVFHWPSRIDGHAIDQLRSWWKHGWMRPAAAIRAASGEEFVVSHGGVTAGFWRELGAPASGQTTAAAINALVHEDPARLFRAGQMLGLPVDRAAGPVWASAASELIPSWWGIALPFSQIHGHTTVIDWDTGRPSGSLELMSAIEIDPAARHEEFHLRGGRIVGIDPGHGQRAYEHWKAFVLDGAEVIG